MSDIVERQNGDNQLPEVEQAVSAYLAACQAQIDAFETRPAERWKISDGLPMIFRTGKILKRRVKLDLGVDLDLVSVDQFLTADQHPDLQDGAPHDFHNVSADLETDRAAIMAATGILL